jgi:hypothetical protein
MNDRASVNRKGKRAVPQYYLSSCLACVISLANTESGNKVAAREALDQPAISLEDLPSRQRRSLPLLSLHYNSWPVALRRRLQPHHGLELIASSKPFWL